MLFSETTFWKYNPVVKLQNTVSGHVGGSQAPILIRLRTTLMLIILVCHFVMKC